MYLKALTAFMYFALNFSIEISTKRREYADKAWKRAAEQPADKKND